MDEQETKTQEGAEETTANSNDGEHDNKVINDAKAIVDGMNEANKKKEELINREEKLQARKESLQALGGGSPGGDNESKPKLSDDEIASRKRIKAVGDASGAAWSKEYE